MTFISTSNAHDHRPCLGTSSSLFKYLCSGPNKHDNECVNFFCVSLFLSTFECHRPWHSFDSKTWAVKRWTHATIKIILTCMESVAVGKIHSHFIASIPSMKWPNFRYHFIASVRSLLFLRLVTCFFFLSFFSSRIINLDEKCKLLWTILKFIKMVCHKNMWVRSSLFALHSVLVVYVFCRRACRKQDLLFFRFFFFFSNGRVHVLVACWRWRQWLATALYILSKWIFDCNLPSAFSWL